MNNPALNNTALNDAALNDAGVSGLDVIVLASGPARREALQRAVFSALMQDHPPQAVIVICTGFDGPARAQLQDDLAPLAAIVPTVALELLDAGAGVAAAWDRALAAATGRYLMLLGDDGVLYPEAARLLMARLLMARLDGTAVAFGGSTHAFVDGDGVCPYTVAKRRVTRCTGTEALRRAMVPLHSFMLDRAAIPGGRLLAGIDSAACLHARLLLVCQRHGASFHLNGTIIGEVLMPAEAGRDYLALRVGTLAAKPETG